MYRRAETRDEGYECAGGLSGEHEARLRVTPFINLENAIGRHCRPLARITAKRLCRHCPTRLKDRASDNTRLRHSGMQTTTTRLRKPL